MVNAVVKRQVAVIIGSMEIGSPPLSSPGAELHEDPEKLHEIGGVHSGSRTSHANCSDTSSDIRSYLDFSLSQLPAYFCTNGKSKNSNAVKRGRHVGFLFRLFAMCLSGLCCVMPCQCTCLGLFRAPYICIDARSRCGLNYYY